LLGVAFFWLTDPTIGLGARWLTHENAVDMAREAQFPTVVGLIGSLMVLIIGIWLGTRRMT
jgi:hypothetical protein